MKNTKLLSVFVLFLTLSSGGQSARIIVKQIGCNIDLESREQHYSDLIYFWYMGSPEERAAIETAVDAGEYLRPIPDFQAPKIAVDSDPGASFKQYIRLKDRAINGDKNPQFQDWFFEWSRTAKQERGPHFRAAFLSHEALYEAMRAEFEARNSPALMVLVDQFKELATWLAIDSKDPNLTFEDIYYTMLEVPSLTPEKDQEERRIQARAMTERASLAAGRLATEARQLKRQQFLDLAGDFHRLSGDAVELDRADRVLQSDLARIYERANALDEQEKAMRVAIHQEEFFSEESLTGDSSDDDEDSNNKKRHREDAEGAADANQDAAPRKLVVKLKLPSRICTAISAQSCGTGGEF